MLLPPYEEIYAIDEDGTDERCLTKIVPHPAWVTTPGYRTVDWSPDGQKIAFEGLRNGKQFDVYVMDADGTHEMRLADGPTPRLGRRYPAWSPDGEQIAFVRSGATAEIYVIDKDGTDETRLTKSDSDPETETNLGDPVWSPDGNKIAFASSATRISYSSDAPDSAGAATAPAAGMDGIYVIDMETGGLRKVLTSPGPSQISWSPDGNKIAFYDEKAISVINADGTGRKKELAHGYSPTWSPDSNKIAFSEISDKPAINLINADGSGREKLTCTEGAGGPFWSPDGEQIAFVKHADLYVINVDGTGLKRLASNLAPKDIPVNVSWGRG
jgi:Tol biopolymer transport system component